MTENKLLPAFFIQSIGSSGYVFDLFYIFIFFFVLMVSGTADNDTFFNCEFALNSFKREIDTGIGIILGLIEKMSETDERKINEYTFSPYYSFYKRYTFRTTLFNDPQKHF
jgi:hypothetical protein